jgi:GT2 family glycosyltransferase|tara:strand:+ start:1226 stop:2179 length:954 start_codon:yes stop_codon:yes gene_type:complete
LTYQNIELIVVDNNSTDNSQNECKQKFPQIKLIQNQNNSGYCGGNNIGIKEAKGEFLVILNPDTVVEPNLIEILINKYSIHGEGLYQPKILSLEDKQILESTGNMIHIFGFGFARDKGNLDNNEINKVTKVGYAAGTCLFSSKKIFLKLKLFDEFLFLYHDDLDLGWRAAQKGIISYIVPQAKIYHAESYSLKWSQKKFFWLERNRRYCLMTHYSKNTLNKINRELLITEFLIWIVYISKGFLSAKIKAELDLIKNKELIIKKQKEIENEKVISDIELINTFPNRIEIPKFVSDNFLTQLFVNSIEKLSKKAKNKLT